MRLQQGFLAALAIVLAGSTARADGPPVRSMTLAEALSFAREHQPAVRAAMARVAAAQEEARVPRAEWLPSVGATLQGYAATANNSTAAYLGSPYVDIPRIGGTKVAIPGSASPYASTFVGAGINQEVFDFGRIAARAAAADALLDAVRHRAAAERMDVDFAVEEAYFAVFSAKAVLKASEQAEERARVHRDLAKAGVTAGMRNPVVLTRAEADLARFMIGTERARAGVEVSQSMLAMTVGVPETRLDVSGTPPSTRDMPSLSDAVKEAASRDPYILEAEARVRAEEKNTKAIAAELRPDLALTATVSVRGGGAPSSTAGVNQGFGYPNVPNYDIGLVLRWPIYNGPTAARERASKAREQVRREELDAVKFARSTAVQQAYLGVSVSKAAIPALERALDAARANYDQAEARFNAGIGDAVELADAEALRTQAEINLIVGRFELARARVTFGRAISEEHVP
jgi:outer membrane protein TolC